MKHKYFKGLKKVPYPYSEKHYPKIDDRDTYNLDEYIIASLYGHLKRYKKLCKDIVDLEYYKFTINGEELTQLQCIERMIDNCGYILDCDYCEDCKERREEKERKMRETFDILKEVLWYLWW